MKGEEGSISGSMRSTCSILRTSTSTAAGTRRSASVLSRSSSMAAECIANVSIPTPTTTGTNPNCPGTNSTRSSVISEADYNAWAAFNSRPLSTTPEGQALIGTDQDYGQCGQAAAASGSSRTEMERCRITSSPSRCREGFATRNSLVL